MLIDSRHGAGISLEIETRKIAQVRTRDPSVATGLASRLRLKQRTFVRRRAQAHRRHGAGISLEIETFRVLQVVKLVFGVATGLASRLRLKQPLSYVEPIYRRVATGLA